MLVPWREFDSRDEWGAELGAQLAVWKPDLVVLSGLMRLLPATLVDAWSPRIINTHPAYLPEFPGAHGVRDALAAGVAQTGASVIIVDNGVDSGPILAQERIPVLPGDDEHSLHERIKPVERRLLIDVVRRIATGELDLAARAMNPTRPSSPPDPHPRSPHGRPQPRPVPVPRPQPRADPPRARVGQRQDRSAAPGRGPRGSRSRDRLDRLHRRARSATRATR